MRKLAFAPLALRKDDTATGREVALLERPTLTGFKSAGATLGKLFLFVVLPALVTGAYLYQQNHLGIINFDFDGTVADPTRAILHGDSPYPQPDRAHVDVGNPAVYPTAIVLFGAPFVAVPHIVGSALWLAMLAGAAGLALWLIGVRDWRVYVLAMTSFPVLHGIVFGNVTILLVLALAVAWRYRDRPLAAGAALGLAVALKLFLWPLFVWLLVTRRFRAAAAAVVTGAVSVLGTWAFIGFAGLADYPHLLSVLTDVYGSHSSSLYALAIALGAGSTAAQVVAAVVGVPLLIGVWLVAGRLDGDRRAFSLAVGAALVLSPVVWPHYFALLIVPLALYRPALSWAWALVPAFWWIAYVKTADLVGVSCCGPRDTPEAIWKPLHAPTPTIQIMGYTLAVAALVALTVLGRRRAASEVVA